MGERDTKERLITAAKDLLKLSETPEKVTARQIAKKADANLAMINYFFKSKDQLMNVAISAIIAEQTAGYHSVINQDLPAKERLYQVLNYFCEVSIEYKHYLEVTVPYNLLTAQLAVPADLLVIIEEFYQNRIPTQFSQIIALQMTTFTELFFLRAEDFKAYSGIDIYDKSEREQYLRFQIELLLQDKKA